jgi:hypothetical protein
MVGGFEHRSVAQRELEAACELLIDPTPENLDRCSCVLGRAVSCLEAGRPAAGEAARLRESVRRAGRLLETAADYHRQWQRILLRFTASGYTAGGELDTPPVRGRVSMEG